MSEPPKRKRRWFQFSLRTLMIVVTLLCISFGFVIRVRAVVVERREELNRLIRLAVKGELADFLHGSGPLPVESVPEPLRAVQLRLRRFFADEPVALIVFPKKPTDDEVQRLARVFPDSLIGFIDGRNYVWLAGTP